MPEVFIRLRKIAATSSLNLCFGRSQRVLIQMDHFFCSAIFLERNEIILISFKSIFPLYTTA